ncbi:MAG TPA: polymer-forming cytoskeletal protein [Polyangiaceae bacterium]|jgi:cytoskeletal protein CcmA (bactofilin family)
MNHSPLEFSVLGPATRVTGRINGAGTLRVEGSVKGDVSVHGETEIADSGSIEGNVHGDAIEIGGKLVGDAEAEGAIAVRSSAHVRGQLRGAEISIEPGARVSVRLETEFELDFGAQRRR